MITVYEGEQAKGRIKFTTDRDCLPADAIRVSVRYFPSIDAVYEEALMLERRGFNVCIDTEEGLYETGPWLT